MEQPGPPATEAIGPPGAATAGRHANRKAVASLVLGCAALASVAALALIVAFDVDENEVERIGAAWLLLPFIGLVAGSIGCFLGAIAWIDVRRGATDRHLLTAQLGALTGGLAAALVLIALVALLILGLILVVGFANSGVD